MASTALYIEEIAIDTSLTTASSNKKTYLHETTVGGANGGGSGYSASNVNYNTDTTNTVQNTGYKWCMDIKNKTNSPVTLTNWGLNICANFYHTQAEGLHDEGIDYYIDFSNLSAGGDVTENGGVRTLAANGKMTLGWDPSELGFERDNATIVENFSYTDSKIALIPDINSDYNLIDSSLSGTTTTSATNAWQTLTKTANVEVSSIELFMHNTGSSVDLVIHVYDTINSGSSADPTVRFSGLTAVHTSSSVAVSTGSATHTGFTFHFTPNASLKASSTFYIWVKEALGGSLGDAKIQKGSGSNGGAGNNSGTLNYKLNSHGNTHYYTSTRFQLQYWGNSKDVVGSTSTTEIGGKLHFDKAIAKLIKSTSNGLSMIRNLEDSTYPYHIYSELDWEIVTLTQSAIGDPHISTLTGHHYKFDYLGAFRMFDNNDADHRIVVNGFSENGPDRWSDKQYITKLYFHENGKSMLITNGFRGEKVKVLFNEGFNIREKDLDFHPTARLYCVNNHKSFLDDKEALEYANTTGCIVPSKVRNEITFLTRDLDISVSNVNEYNLQPCRFIYRPINMKDTWSGCIVDIKYSTNNTLNNIYDLREIGEPTEEDLKSLPETEIPTYIQNSRWK